MIYFSYMYTIENIHWKFNLPHYFSLNYSLSIKERAFIECVLKYSSNGKLQNKFVANLPEAVWRVKMLTVKIHDINTFILLVSNKGRDSLGKVQIQIYSFDESLRLFLVSFPVYFATLKLCFLNLVVKTANCTCESSGRLQYRK